VPYRADTRWRNARCSTSISATKSNAVSPPPGCACWPIPSPTHLAVALTFDAELAVFG